MSKGRDLFDDTWAFTKSAGSGAWNTGAGMVEGIKGLAKGGYKLTTDKESREAAWEKTKELAEVAKNYGEAVYGDPGKPYRDAHDGTLAAIETFEKARDLAETENRLAEFYGEITGSGVFEVATVLVPVGVVAKAGRLGKVASVADDVADIAKGVEKAEDALGASQRAKRVSAKPAIIEPDAKSSSVARCPVRDCDDGVGMKNTGKAPETQFGKLRLSYKYYKKLGWPKGRIKSHLDGIDFSKPVKLTELPKGNKTSQFQVPGGKTGNYFAKPKAKATELGINPSAEVDGLLVEKTKTAFELNSNTTVLESTAKSGIVDTWSVPSKPFKTTGGGTQYFTRDNTVFIPKD